MSFLVLDNVQKTYADGTSAVRGVDLSFDEGEFIVLLGPSGCGKTTTLRMIAGLELATGGRISLAGRDVTTLKPSQRDVGFVFQFYSLYPHLTVRENVLFPLKAVGTSGEQCTKLLDDVVRRVGLKDMLDYKPRQLSGGDQQRVSLARAMIRKPAVWLMDEPLGTLDADRRLALREFVREQQQEMKVTTVYVTHDQEEAMSLADRIVVMNGGKIQQVGKPIDVYEQPANLFVANFVGSPGMNFIKGNIAVYGDTAHFLPYGQSTPIELPHHVKPGPITLGVRGEHVTVNAHGPVVGKVVMDEFLGSSRSVHVETAFGKIWFRADAQTKRAVGDEVRLAFDVTKLSLFDGHSGARLASD